MDKPRRTITKKPIYLEKKKTLLLDRDSTGVFKVSGQYRGIVSKVIKRIKRTEPIRILFVCPEGLGMSAIGAIRLNNLAFVLGIGTKIMAENDSCRLAYQGGEQLKKFDYIVPKYNEDTGFVRRRYTSMCPQGKAVVLDETPFSKYSMQEPKTYRDLLLQILLKEARKGRKQ